METPLMSIEKGLQSSKRWIATLYTLIIYKSYDNSIIYSFWGTYYS